MCFTSIEGGVRTAGSLHVDLSDSWDVQSPSRALSRYRFVEWHLRTYSSPVPTVWDAFFEPHKRRPLSIDQKSSRSAVRGNAIKHENVVRDCSCRLLHSVCLPVDWFLRCAAAESTKYIMGLAICASSGNHGRVFNEPLGLQYITSARAHVWE